MSSSVLHILIGWAAIFLGILSGAATGLFFHRDDWAGGYASFRRRMLRLGHISFLGLGLLNLLFGFTLRSVALPPPNIHIATLGFLVGAVAMPLSCFLSAWRKPFRLMFPVPVLAVLAGILSLLLGWARS